MILSECAICRCKKSRFIKNQEAKGLLCNLGLRTLLSKVPRLGVQKNKNELDKAYFQHDMAYEDFKDLAKITASYKVLKDKAFNIAKNDKYDGYQRRLASIVYNFFDKKSALLSDKSVAGSSGNLHAKDENL